MTNGLKLELSGKQISASLISYTDLCGLDCFSEVSYEIEREGLSL